MSFALGHEVTHFITIVPDGRTFYHSWSQNMIAFLKERKFWCYVTGAVSKPIPLSRATNFDNDSASEQSF
jgi:hypothetical protein